MTETFFFAAGEIPECTTPEWYATIPRAPHLEEDGHRPRLLLAADFVRDAISRGCDSVSDLGAGDGGLLYLIRDEPVPAWGYDLIPANVEAALHERHVPVSLRNFETDEVEFGECVVLTEVLEHLLDPSAVLAALPEHVRFVVASSPDGETWERRYENHTWGFDLDGYRTLFERSGWKVVRHETIGFQVLLASR